MTPVRFEDVLDARERLAGVANRTPVVTSRTLDRIAGRRLFLKLESLQRGGAFKFRGAYNKISRLSPADRARGVVAYSSGNHAQGVALAAQLLDTPATIVMPADAPRVKLEATRGYGAEVVLYDRYTEDRARVGLRVSQERGATLVPPYDDPAIVAGQGTAALELVEEVPDLDALVVPVSGGGLISGSALAAHGLRPDLRVIGVEPESGNDTRLSLERGQRVSLPVVPPTIADGLRVQTPGEVTFPIVREHVSDVVLVSDAEILDAMRFALLRMKLVIEPSGAVPLAALLAGRLPPAGRVGLLISGGNVDPDLMARLWAETSGPDAAVPQRSAAAS